VSPVAAELYRKVLILDGNVLGAIGFPISDHDLAGVTKRIVGSGVNVVKATLGGAQGNFEEAVAAIANAELLMEKQPEAFFKVQRAADFDRAKNEGKLGVIYSFESPNMFEDKIEDRAVPQSRRARDAAYLQSTDVVRVRLSRRRHRRPDRSGPWRRGQAA